MTNKEKLEYSNQLLTEIGADIEDGKELYNIGIKSAEATKGHLAQLIKEFDDLAKNINAFGSEFYDKSRLLLKAKLEFCERALTSYQAKKELSETLIKYLDDRRKLGKEFFDKKSRKR
jgi:hypothetical protein